MTSARRFLLAAVTVCGGSLWLAVRELPTAPVRLPGAWAISLGAGKAAAAEPDLAEPEVATADPAPPPPPEPAPPGVAAELAAMRAEIAELRRQIIRRTTPVGGNPLPGGGGPAVASAVATSPAGGNSSYSPEAPVGILAIALASLAVGWVFGSFYMRRRGRSQRNRLRF